jgi:hypothetical protein
MTREITKDYKEETILLPPKQEKEGVEKEIEEGSEKEKEKEKGGGGGGTRSSAADIYKKFQTFPNEETDKKTFKDKHDQVEPKLQSMIETTELSSMEDSASIDEKAEIGDESDSIFVVNAQEWPDF